MTPSMTLYNIMILGVHFNQKPQNLNGAYFGFVGSVLGHSKHVGPLCETPGDIHLIYLPIVSF